jgi:uncharacterized lipoprotein
MMGIKNTLMVLSITAILMGCSSVTNSSLVQKAGLFPDRENAYLEGRSVPPLKTPADVPAIPNDPYYAIPDASVSSQKPVSLLPPGSLAAKKAGSN